MTEPEPVRLAGSEVHVLHSDAVGDDFEISVIRPAFPVDGPLAVAYFTDATLGVGMAADIVNLLQGPGEIPPLLLVCVGYPVDNDWAEFVRLRTRDFTPTRDAALEPVVSETIGGRAVVGGGADAFLEFLTRELRDWVRTRYVVSDDSTLVGYSEGGLFATYTLLHRPAAFRRYLIGSPDFTWNREISTAYEAQYAEEHDDLDATVFLCAGADEAELPPALPPAVVRLRRDADAAVLTEQLGASLQTPPPPPRRWLRRPRLRGRRRLGRQPPPPPPPGWRRTWRRRSTRRRRRAPPTTRSTRTWPRSRRPSRRSCRRWSPSGTCTWRGRSSGRRRSRAPARWWGWSAVRTAGGCWPRWTRMTRRGRGGGVLLTFRDLVG